MSLLRWFTANTADTSVPTHADLAPLTLPGGVAEVVTLVRSAIAGRANWAVAPDSPGVDLRLTRRTTVMRYTDDIRLTLTATGGSVVIHAESASRVGKGDLGQNRRNILELWALLRAARGVS